MGYGSEAADFFVKILRYLTGRKRKVLFQDVLKDSVRVHEICSSLVFDKRELQIDFAFLMMAHNSGSKVVPHGLLYHSIVGGAYIKEWLPNFDIKNYQNNFIGIGYRHALEKMCTNEFYEITTRNNTDPDFSIRFRYEKIAVERFYYLHEDEYCLWYFLMGTTLEDFKMDTPEHNQKMFFTINEIKRIIKKYT